MVGKLLLHRASFEFSQDGNTDGTTGDCESLTIDVEACWMDDHEPGYFVLRTDGWSLDSEYELMAITQKIAKAIKDIKQ